VRITNDFEKIFLTMIFAMS